MTFDDRERLKQRLKSFVGWTSSKQFIGLAAAGFRYTGQLDRVKCDYCNKKVVQWTDDDDPIEVHIRFSPSCIFVKKLGYTPEQRLARSPKYSQSSDRLASVKMVPSEYHVNLPSFESIADAGFFYQGTLDRMMCYSCGLILKDWEPSTEPFGIHKRFRPGCFFVQCMDVRKAGFDPLLSRGQDNDILLSMRELSVTAVIGRSLGYNSNWTITASRDSVTNDVLDSGRDLPGTYSRNNTDALSSDLTNASSTNIRFTPPSGLASTTNQSDTNEASNMISLNINPLNTQTSLPSDTDPERPSVNPLNTGTSLPSNTDPRRPSVNSLNTETSLPSNIVSEWPSVNPLHTGTSLPLNIKCVENATRDSSNIPEFRTVAPKDRALDNWKPKAAESSDRQSVFRSCGMESRQIPAEGDVLVDDVDSLTRKENTGNIEIDSGNENSDEDMPRSPRTLSSDFHGFDEVDSFNNLDGNSSGNQKNERHKDSVDSFSSLDGNAVGAFFFENSESENQEDTRAKKPKNQNFATKPGRVSPETKNCVPVKQTKGHFTPSSNVTCYKNRKKKIKGGVSDASVVQSKSKNTEAEHDSQEHPESSSGKTPVKVNIKLKGHFGNIPKVNVNISQKPRSSDSNVKKTETRTTAVERVNQSTQGQGQSDFPDHGSGEYSDSPVFQNIQGATSSNRSDTVPYSLPTPQSQNPDHRHGQRFQSLPPVYDFESFEDLPMVQAVMELGVSLDTIVDAVNRRFHETGDTFPDAAALLSTIFDST